MSTETDDSSRGRFRTIADRLHGWRGEAEGGADAGEHDERDDRIRGGATLSETLNRIPQAHPRAPEEFAPKGDRRRRRVEIIEGRDQPVDLDEHCKRTAGRRRPAADIAAELVDELRAAAAGAENRRADLAGHGDDGSILGTGDRSTGAATVAARPNAAAPDGSASYLPTLESGMAGTKTADEQLAGLGEMGAQILATFNKIVVKARTTAADERAAVERDLVEERARTADLAAEVSDLKTKLAAFEAWKAAMPGQAT